jgi:hypothetical protein
MKALYFILVLIVLIPLFMGCLEEDTMADTVTPRIAVLEAWKANMEPQISNGNQAWVWKTSTFDPWQTNVFTPWKTTVDAKLGTAGTPSVDLSQYVLASTYNTKIADFEKRIAALESGSGGGGGGGTTPGGETLSTNGDLELSIEKSVDSELWINHNQGQTFFLNVKNKGTSGTYYRINANFDLSDAATVALTSATLGVGNSSMVTFASSTTLPATVSGFAFTSQSGSSSGSKIWIGKNSNISLVLVLTINYVDPNVANKLWTWDYSIRQLN